jgi:hypothetical protein
MREQEFVVQGRRFILTDARPQLGDLLVLYDWPASSPPTGWTVLEYADGAIAKMYRLVRHGEEDRSMPGQVVLRPAP